MIPATESAQRGAVIAEARSWIGTPYRHMGRHKGAGVDCAMLPALVYEAAGIIGRVEIGHYPPDWHLHRDTERYRTIVESYATPTDTPMPGDFAMWKIGRAYAHGGIIVNPGWPEIVHADMEARHVILARGDGGRLAGRPPIFFTVWPRQLQAQRVAA
jgi:cell wall-associated NlpC family hydrolase